MSEHAPRPQDPWPRTYRPWFAIAALSVCLGLMVWKSVPIIIDTLQPGVPVSVREAGLRPLLPFLLLGGVFVWYMTNRLKLDAGRFDNRYLWRRQMYQRHDILRVEDVQGLRGRTVVVLAVRQPDGSERQIVVSPPGEGGKALVAWLQGVPGTENAAKAEGRPQ